MDEENKDVNNETVTQEDSSTSNETADNVSQDVKTDQDDAAKVAEELLADSTSKKKIVPIPYERFVELNEKAKLMDQMGPLMSRLQQNPEVLDKINVPSPESVEARLAHLEEEQRVKKQVETRTVVEQAVKTWGEDFTKRFKGDIQPLVAALEKQGISYADAVQRAYFAVNPEAAQKETRLVEEGEARVQQNRMGRLSSSGGVMKPVKQEQQNVVLSDIDRDFAQKAGIDPSLYSKHMDWMRSKGFDKL